MRNQFLRGHFNQLQITTSKVALLGVLLGGLSQQALGQPALPTSGASVVTLTNPGFEGDYKPVPSSSDAPIQKAVITGQTAEGWSDNSNWADVDVEYSKETVNVHRGTAAQKINVKRVTSGAVQFVQPVTFRKGRVHLWRLWLRGTPGTSVNLMLRKAGSPYNEYANQPVSLAAEWKEVRVFAVIPEDTDGFLMIRAAQPMTFWVDDAELQDLTSASSDAPAKKGNLLIGGGSFEAGMPYGWSVRFEGAMENRYADPRPRIDRATAKVGAASLRSDILPGDNLQVRSPIWSFNYNRPHTVSVWLKAAKPQTSVQIYLSNDVLNQWVEIGTQWQRVTFTATPPYLPHLQLRFHVPGNESPEGNTLWIDGVQIEESTSASAEYSQPYPVDLVLDLPRPGHIVFDDVKAAVNLSTAGKLPRDASLRWTYTNLSLPNFSRTQHVNRISNGGSIALPANQNWRGMWKVYAEIVDASDKPVSAPYELIWARLPRPKNIDPKNSYFGNHISLAPYYIQLAKALGTRRVRLHDTSMIAKWPFAEPEPGKWKFYDEGVTAAHKSGLRILGMLDGAPKWTSTKPNTDGYWDIWNIPDKPEAKSQWETYVRTVTSHYQGRIDDWEIWNEPWGKWWSSSGNPNATPELYADLMKRAYRVAKASNPNATIVGVDTYSGHDKWTNGVLASANGDHFDVFSFHDYNDALYGGPDVNARLQAKVFNDVQRKYGPVRPLWNTEGGLFSVGSWYTPQSGGMSVQIQPAYMVRYDVSYMSAGVKNFFLYAIHTDNAMGEIETRVMEHDRCVKPILAARAVLASLVDGLGTPKRSEPMKGVDLYTYPRDVKANRTVSVTWSYDGSINTLILKKGFKALDIWGNVIATKGKVSIGPEPVYLVQ